MKKKAAVTLSLKQALKMSSKKINRLPEGSTVDCKDGWGFFRTTSSVKDGLWWFVGKDGCLLDDYGNPISAIYGYHAGHFHTFKMAHALWLKNKERLTTKEIREILYQQKIDDEDSW